MHKLVMYVLAVRLRSVVERLIKMCQATASEDSSISIDASVTCLDIQIIINMTKISKSALG